MQKIAKVIVPAFTDYYHYNYLDEVLTKIQGDEVILFEFYNELKEPTMQFLKGELSNDKFIEESINIILKIDPEIINTKPNHKISPSHYYILNKLRGKKLLAFEILEDYENHKKVLNERNKNIYKNIGSLLNKYSGLTNKFIILMATAHTDHLRYNLKRNNELDLMKYTDFELKDIIKFEEKKDSSIDKIKEFSDYSYDLILEVNN